ncbi:hypothetical protein BO78DRAFT_119224 [Aspergillus sclerotiicarbonarius CBS 121057]|uniref:Uncharacterized protein n=1 Tax=Aspergillus sclerotiicarbonarius (strain CBS 121057 / IBT 28362) TaxID=1448318 RepID=A0A319E8H0_ASPSB|nr:hypothetical protein BO78DRAFT_119224 [Aspergillus sclerotiicarbonarius CBS 121057]
MASCQSAVPPRSRVSMLPASPFRSFASSLRSSHFHSSLPWFIPLHSTWYPHPVSTPEDLWMLKAPSFHRPGCASILVLTAGVRSQVPWTESREGQCWKKPSG